MSQLTYKSVNVGDDLPPLDLPPISRTTLALYAGASGDHNPIHIDIDFAKQAGMPDVFVHGMLSMAWLGRFVTGWVPQSALRSLSVRFGAITHVRDRIACSGKVVEKLERNGEHLARIELRTADQNGETKLVGEALVALP